MSARIKFTVLFLLCLVVNSFATYVAVLETMSSSGALGLSERMYLTDKLREIASRTLPAYMDYTIMTRENINAMLPPGKTIEECEGSCLAETGRNIAADFIAQGRIGMFGQQLTLTVELYETASNKLVGSFTARKPDAEDLIEDIEEKSPELFELVKGGPAGVPASKADDFRSYVVDVQTDPVGALLSVDGKPQGSCKNTPCNVYLTPGRHRFLFVSENYKDLDTVVDVWQDNQKLWASMEANFGTITVAPVFTDNYEAAGHLRVTVNGKTQSGSKFRLAPGNYKIAVSHRCYETRESTVNVSNGSKLKFSKALDVAMAGITIESAENGNWDDPEPVYVNGVQVGVTPYTGQVPVCAKIQMGVRKETMVTDLKPGQKNRYVYKPSKYSSVYGKEDYQASHLDAPVKASTFDGSGMPKDTIGRETKLFFNVSFGGLLYTSNGEERSDTDFKFGLGFEYDLATSRRFVFGLGLGMSFETQNIQYDIYNSNSSYYGDYYYYSDYVSYSDDVQLINIDAFCVLGVGWAGFKFFARAGLSFNVSMEYGGMLDLESVPAVGMFELGFRFARNHEFYVGVSGGMLEDTAQNLTSDNSIFFGYRYAPTVGRKAF